MLCTASLFKGSSAARNCHCSRKRDQAGPWCVRIPLGCTATLEPNYIPLKSASVARRREISTPHPQRLIISHASAPCLDGYRAQPVCERDKRCQRLKQTILHGQKDFSRARRAMSLGLSVRLLPQTRHFRKLLDFAQSAISSMRTRPHTSIQDALRNRADIAEIQRNG